MKPRFSRIVGAGGGKGGGGSRTPKEAPDTLLTDATVYIVDVVSEGEIEGWADPDHPARCVILDGTPLENADGSLNFEGVSFTLRTGTSDQTSVPGFAAAEAEVAVGVTVTDAAPVSRTITNADADAVRIAVGTPRLLSINAKNGDIKPTRLEFAIDRQVGGAAFETVYEGALDGKASSEYIRAIRFELPAERPVTYRVRRITPESTTERLSNDLVFSSLTEIVDAKFSYPDTAYVAISAPAEAFGGRMPVRTYLLKGLLCYVPSDYDPEARTYAGGIWDGSLVRAWTRNPAWVLYSLIADDRWGLGDRIGAGAPDRYAFYEIGRYCDELVDDGQGGLEPRYSLDGPISSAEDAYAVLTQMASLFRGQVFFGGGQVVPVADMPADPVALATNAGVIDGRFEYAGTGRAARHTGARVSHRDATDRYAIKELVSYDDPAARAKWGENDAELIAPYTVSPGEALRAAKWIVDTDTTQAETVTYVAGLDHAGVRPGDIVLVQDEQRVGMRYGGRLAAVGATTVTLDRPVTFDPASSYALHVAETTGGLRTLAVVTSGESALTEFQVAEDLASLPIAPGALWAFTVSGATPRRFRVLTIAPQEGGLQYLVTAVEDDPTKYDRVERGLIVETAPPFVLPPEGVLPPPLAIVGEEALYTELGQVKSRLDLTVTPTTDPRARAIEVQARLLGGGEGYASLGTRAGVSFSVPDAGAGTWQVRARSVDALERQSAWQTVNILALGLLAPPSDIARLDARLSSGRLELSWSAVSDFDLAGYAIRFSTATSGASWGAAAPVISVPPGVIVATVPAQTGTWFVAAIDTSGKRSASPASRVVTVEALDGFNVLEEVAGGDAAAGVWDGVATDTAVIAGEIRLGDGDDALDWSDVYSVADAYEGPPRDVSVDSGVWEFAEIVDLGDRYPVRITSELSARGVRPSNDAYGWADAFALEDVFGADPSEWTAGLEVATSDTAAGAPLGDWSDWSPLALGEITARGVRFRLALSRLSPDVEPIVSSARVVVDVPDRTEGERGLACPAAGLRVSFPSAFSATPAVAVEVETSATGERHAITNADATGFDLQCFDAGGAAVARTFGYVARGYGRRL